MNKLPEIGENVLSRIEFDSIGKVKSILTENLTPKVFDSSGPQSAMITGRFRRKVNGFKFTDSIFHSC